MRRRRAGRRGALLTSIAVVPLALGSPPHALAQASDPVAGSIELGARGGPVTGGPTRPASFEERRGRFRVQRTRWSRERLHLSRHHALKSSSPRRALLLKRRSKKFYVGATVASVVLPTQPTAELTYSSGVRPKLGNIDFDLGWTYFAYPGEISGSNTEYWEAVARADTKIGDLFHIAGGFAYSPNVSNTGAWSKYAAFGVGVEDAA